MNKLIQLRLEQNYFFSPLGAWILQHPSLDSVFLGSNYLHGSFPNITNQHNISILSLDCNYLSGPEPKLSNISYMSGVSAFIYLTTIRASAIKLALRLRCRRRESNWEQRLGSQWLQL